MIFIENASLFLTEIPLYYHPLLLIEVQKNSRLCNVSLLKVSLIPKGIIN